MLTACVLGVYHPGSTRRDLNDKPASITPSRKRYRKTRAGAKVRALRFPRECHLNAITGAGSNVRITHRVV